MKQLRQQIHTYIHINNHRSSGFRSNLIIDRLLRQCCFVWFEIVGPHSSGNFNDWLLWLLIVNALQLNELSARRNTFYWENKYLHAYIHTLLRLPLTGLLLNSNYIQIYSKYIPTYFVWDILLKGVRLKLSISLVFLILSASPFHSLGTWK